jgi:formamidopyrimidine-DNA glycosylase
VSTTRLQVLYQSRIHPEVVGANMDEAQLKALHDAIKVVLDVSIAVDSEAAKLPPDWLFHFRCG